MSKLAEFIASHQIEVIGAKHVDLPPEALRGNLEDKETWSDPDYDAFKWVQVVLRRGDTKGRLTVTLYRADIGSDGGPDFVEHVLYQVLERWREYPGTGFEDWCQQMNYDSDSRKVERRYRYYCDQAKRVSQWFRGAYWEKAACANDFPWRKNIDVTDEVQYYDLPYN